MPPLLVGFADFAQRRGAVTVSELPDHVEAFVAEELSRRRRARGRSTVREDMAKEIRGPVEQMLSVVVPGFEPSGRRRRPLPFAEAVPGFFDYLSDERGLRPASIQSYRHHLNQFEEYLARVGVHDIGEVSPELLSAFIADRAALGLVRTSIGQACAVLRVFFRYAHRQDVLDRDLSVTIEGPQKYRLSGVPRSITWDEVGRVLAGPDRRTPCGKRDYAMLLLLVTYGLRGREVAGLRLEDIDWKQERLAVPERKAGHSTAFPLSTAVGEAILDYLQHGRPSTTDRHVFLRSVAPVKPLGTAAVSSCARRHLLNTGVQVPRPGSHTLRHTCVQRLVDANFALKTIGDYIGHREASSTEIYAKVAIEPLRQVALGNGEEVLS